MTSLDVNRQFPDPTSHREFYDHVLTKRLFAFLIDTALITLITGMFVVFTAFVALLFVGFLGLVISLIYRIVSLAGRSATPGMRLMGIQFRTHRGNRLSSGLAIAHTIGFTLSMSMVLPQVISIILMLTTARGQSLIDLLLGTAVINRSAIN